MGVSLNGGTPHFTPQNVFFFSQKTKWLLGKPTILGNPYMDVSKNIGTPKWMIYNGKPY